MKNRALNISIMITILSFSFINTALSGVDDDYPNQQDSNVDDAQVDVSDSSTVVVVSQDDPVLTATVQTEQNAVTSNMDIATSLTVGYIQANMTEEEIISTLTTNLGYTQTEAKIAFAKASVLAGEENTTRTVEVLDNSEQETPTVSAKDRVHQGVTQNSASKFHNFSRQNNDENGNETARNVTEEETNTVTQMQEEGYSIGDIAQGFSDNNYSNSEISAIFKESGVSAGDTYEALSTMELEEVEAEYSKERPTAKFGNWSNNDPETSEKNAKKDAVVGILTEMKEAGYDVTTIADVAAQDLKAAGLSATEAYNALQPIVAPARSTSKFKSGGRQTLWARIIAKATGKDYKGGNQPHGEGEYALAAAMMSAGYEKSAVAAEFRKSFNDKDVLMIMSSGETRYLAAQNNQNNTNSTNNIKNTNTEQDILQRKTNSLPI